MERWNIGRDALYPNVITGVKWNDVRLGKIYTSGAKWSAGILDASRYIQT